MTLAEVMALPEYGGGFGSDERLIDGKCVRVPVLARPLVAFYVDDSTPMQWREADGSRWRLARYADGSWCKRRMIDD